MIQCKLEVFLRVFFDRGGTTPYHGALMTEGAHSQTLPRHVTPRKLAYSGATLSGDVSARELGILAGAVDYIGGVSASLAFSINDQGKMQVVGSIEAALGHQCQRCLQTMPTSRDVAKVAVCIVRNEEEAKQLPRNMDPWIVPDDDADLYTLVEEELLLVLPVVAYHQNACVDLDALNGSPPAEEPKEKANPFSVLSALKGSGESGTE